MNFKVVLEQGEDGFIVASVPSIPGCVTQGKTEKEALKNVQEAISLHVDSLRWVHTTKSGALRVREHLCVRCTPLLCNKQRSFLCTRIPRRNSSCSGPILRVKHEISLLGNL